MSITILAEKKNELVHFILQIDRKFCDIVKAAVHRESWIVSLVFFSFSYRG